MGTIVVSSDLLPGYQLLVRVSSVSVILSSAIGHFCFGNSRVFMTSVEREGYILVLRYLLAACYNLGFVEKRLARAASDDDKPNYFVGYFVNKGPKCRYL